MLGINLIERCKIADVGEEASCLHNLAEGRAGRFKDRLDIGNRRFSLSLDVFRPFTRGRIDRQLAGTEHKIAGLNALRIRPMAAGAFSVLRMVFSIIKSFPECITILEVFFQASSSFYADKWYTGIPNSKSRIIPWAIFQNWQVSWISYP